MNEATEAIVERRLRAAISNPVGNFSEAMTWLEWLDGQEAALVKARLEGARWKMICWRFGISRATAYRRWRHALGVIAWNLNGHELPTGCSRRRFMQLTTPNGSAIKVPSALPELMLKRTYRRVG